MRVNLEALARFLVDAKKHTWAAGAQTITPERADFKEIPFTDGHWHYLDSYTRSYARSVLAHGDEVVRYKRRPVWLMSYRGGMLPEFQKDRKLTKETFEFLRKVLLNVDTDFPFRGPAIYIDTGRFEYHNSISGTIADFTGTEVICDRHGDKTKLYQAYYLGGLIVPCR
jgi:hypothetical protein